MRKPSLLARQLKSILWLNIKATLSYYPGTLSTWVLIAKSAFTEGFSQACQTMNAYTTGPVEPLNGINKDVCGAKL